MEFVKRHDTTDTARANLSPNNVIILHNEILH